MDGNVRTMSDVNKMYDLVANGGYNERISWSMYVVRNNCRPHLVYED